MTRYEYSVIRYMPDRLRGEVVNIGILLFHENRVDARILPDLRKAKAINPNVDLEELYKLPETFAGMRPLQTLQNIEAKFSLEFLMATLIVAGFPGIVLSQRGWFTADGKQEIERNITEICARLCEVPHLRITDTR